jgi:hypothetical protein
MVRLLSHHLRAENLNGKILHLEFQHLHHREIPFKKMLIWALLEFERVFD